MNWLNFSSIMFFASVSLYLFVRKSSISNNPTQFNNLAMFLVPLVVYSAIGLSTNVNYQITFKEFVIIFFSGVVFSYLGNVFSLKSIELAPNPGYSLVLSKSYVVFTTIFSFLFLNGDLSLKKILAIALIVIFSALVTINPKQSRAVKSNLWLPLSFGAFFAWGFLSLVSKYLANLGVPTIVFLTYLYIVVSASVLLEIKIRKISLKNVNSFWKFFLAIGLSSAFFNYFTFAAIRIAPNVGYVNAINASSISLVTILSILLFKDEFAWRKLVGIFGITAGLLLLLV